MVKKIGLFIAFLCLIGLISSQDADAARRRGRKRPSSLSACPKVVPVSAGGLFIYKNSAPLRGGSRNAIVGFRQEPTLIMNRNVSSRGVTNIYDSRGNAIGRCPWASAHGHSGGRYRCTMNTGGLRRTAVRNTGRAAVYFKITRKVCVQIPDAGRCYGSVKGLCNRTIK